LSKIPEVLAWIQLLETPITIFVPPDISVVTFFAELGSMPLNVALNHIFTGNLTFSTLVSLHGTNITSWSGESFTVTVRNTSAEKRTRRSESEVLIGNQRAFAQISANDSVQTDSGVFYYADNIITRSMASSDTIDDALGSITCHGCRYPSVGQCIDPVSRMCIPFAERSTSDECFEGFIRCTDGTVGTFRTSHGIPEDEVTHDAGSTDSTATGGFSNISTVATISGLAVAVTLVIFIAVAYFRSKTTHQPKDLSKTILRRGSNYSEQSLWPSSGAENEPNFKVRHKVVDPQQSGQIRVSNNLLFMSDLQKFNSEGSYEEGGTGTKWTSNSEMSDVASSWWPETIRGEPDSESDVESKFLADISQLVQTADQRLCDLHGTTVNGSFKSASRMRHSAAPMKEPVYAVGNRETSDTNYEGSEPNYYMGNHDEDTASRTETSTTYDISSRHRRPSSVTSTIRRPDLDIYDMSSPLDAFHEEIDATSTSDIYDFSSPTHESRTDASPEDVPQCDIYDFSSPDNPNGAAPSRSDGGLIYDFSAPTLDVSVDENVYQFAHSTSGRSSQFQWDPHGDDAGELYELANPSRDNGLLFGNRAQHDSLASEDIYDHANNTRRDSVASVRSNPYAVARSVVVSSAGSHHTSRVNPADWRSNPRLSSRMSSIDSRESTYDFDYDQLFKRVSTQFQKPQHEVVGPQTATGASSGGGIKLPAMLLPQEETDDDEYTSTVYDSRKNSTTSEVSDISDVAGLAPTDDAKVHEAFL
jgi:hypothetical protein